MNAPPFISGLLAHTPNCPCRLCTADLRAMQVEADQDRADREEAADSDADIDFARGLAADWAERGGAE